MSFSIILDSVKLELKCCYFMNDVSMLCIRTVSDVNKKYLFLNLNLSLRLLTVIDLLRFSWHLNSVKNKLTRHQKACTLVLIFVLSRHISFGKTLLHLFSQ
jgi:hypothetical protein